MFSYQRQAKRVHALQTALQQAKHVQGDLEVLVRVGAGQKEEARKILENLGKISHVYKRIPYLAVKSNAHEVEGLLTQMRKKRKIFRTWLQDLELAQKIQLFPTMEGAYEQAIWNLEQIGTYKAHQYTRGEKVTVAVMDTGVDYKHIEVAQSFGREKGKNFVTEGNPSDDNGHGTHVAGVIAGRTYGVAPDSTLYSLKVLDAEGNGMETDALEAFEWALEKRVHVINMSWGGKIPSRAMEELCYEAAAKGVVLVAAAGNEGYGASYPAAFDDAVISVAAVDKNNKHPKFSNIYETNDISAPGVNISSCYPGGYKVLTGTSMAAPHVAGGVALSMALRMQHIEEKIKEKAEPLGREDVFGAGLLRIDRVVQETKKEELWRKVKELVW